MIGHLLHHHATTAWRLRAVAAAKPDGQTLFVAVGTNVIINPHVQKGMIDTIATLAASFHAGATGSRIVLNSSCALATS